MHIQVKNGKTFECIFIKIAWQIEWLYKFPKRMWICEWLRNKHIGFHNKLSAAPPLGLWRNANQHANWFRFLRNEIPNIMDKYSGHNHIVDYSIVSDKLISKLWQYIRIFIKLILQT